MSSSITNNNKIKKNSLKNELFINKIFTYLNDIEKKSKNLSIKYIAIRENIRSIKLKEKKIEKINQTILNKKEELKLLKELFSLKGEKNMNIKEILDSYIDFIISSNDILNNKINALFQKEMSINPKQKYINKILGNDNEIENDYDYIYENINKPIDVTKFLINPKKKNNNDGRIAENGGRENLGRYIINKKEKNNINNINFSNNNNNTSNYTNLYQSKKNRISSSSSYEKISNGIKIEKISNSLKNKNSNAKNKDNSNKLTKIDENFLPQKNSINENNNFIINKLSIGKDYKKKENNVDILNYDEYNRKDIDTNCRNMNKNIINFAQTDINDFNNYNLKPNNKLEKARIIFQRLLYKLKNTNKLYFTGKDNNCLKHFFLNVLNSKYFLKKALSIIFECNEIYGPNNKRTITETIHDSEFLSKLNNYEDSEDNCENDIEKTNNIEMFEKGLEDIKKVTNETKQLKDKISKFAYKINFAE